MRPRLNISEKQGGAVDVQLSEDDVKRLEERYKIHRILGTHIVLMDLNPSATRSLTRDFFFPEDKAVLVGTITNPCIIDSQRQ